MNWVNLDKKYFKMPHMKAQFDSTSLFLQLIGSLMQGIFNDINAEFIITRVSDPVKGESGVHLDNRGFDVRYEYGGKAVMEEKFALAIVKVINDLFPRNDSYKTCMLHSFGGGPKHFHVQLAVTTKVYTFPLS